MNVRKDLKSFDFILLLLVTFLVVFGIVVLGSITRTRLDVVKSIYDKQKIFFLIGLILMFITAMMDYKFICRFYLVFYVLNIILLIAVLIFSDNEVSARTNTARWISIGGFVLQPSEFSKLFLIIFLAQYIDKKKDTINNILVLCGVLGLTAIPLLLIMIQPSLSASLVSIAIVVSILYVAKISYKYVVAVMSTVIPVILLFAYDIFFNSYRLFTFLVEKGILKNYHLLRIQAFIQRDATDDYFWQTAQSMSAIGSGGLLGKGIYNGTLNKLGFIANTQNDFIFAVIGEEFGFVGCVAVLLLMILIIVKCLLIANRSSTNLGKLLISGIVGMFGFQAFINVCVATGLCPNTGMPFPFLSSGGSSMIVNMIALGIVINIGMERPKSIFEG